MGLEPGDLAGAGPGHDGEQLAVTVDDSQGGVAGLDGDDAPGVGQADLDVLAGDPMPPRLDNTRIYEGTNQIQRMVIARQLLK
jgi:hypothetical protein